MIHSKPIRVLVLLQRPEAWINLESLWRYLCESSDFLATLWVLPYNVEDKKLSENKKFFTRRLLKDASVSFHEWGETDILGPNQFDVVVLNHPYDRERPKSLWVKNIKKVVPIVIYIPYGLIMGGGYKNVRLQFAQTTQIFASAIVARSEHEKELYEKYCPIGAEHVHVLGQPRFDQVLRRLKEPFSHSLERVVAGRLCILWNSHFSFGQCFSQSSNFSTFDLVGPEIFELALAWRGELCLLWRPHPGLFPAIVREGLLEDSDIPVLKSELTSVGIIVDDTPDHLCAFRLSDALLTDVGTFLLEYLVTGKPILSLRNPEGEPLNEEAERLVQHYESASDPLDVKRFIEKLLNDNVDVSGIERARARHLPMLDGLSSKRVANLMLALHRGEGVCVESSSAGPGLLFSITRSKAVDTDAVSTRPIGVAVDMPPTLSRLVKGLKNLRNEKKREHSFKKRFRAVINRARVFGIEKVKRSFFLMWLIRNFR